MEGHENNNNNELTRIEQMASLLLTGSGYSDYAHSKALEIFLHVVKKARNASSRKDVLNDAKQQIWSFLHRDDSRTGKTTMKKVEEFVNHLDELSREMYNGSLQNLYRNKKHVRSAYIWAIQAEIIRRSEAKKQEREGGMNNDDD